MDRTEAILRHLARYRVSVRPVLEKLYFDGKDSKNALEQLRKDGLIESVARALKNNMSYYHLTAAGAKTIGAAATSASSPGGASLNRNLKILYFCTMASAPRERLLEPELRGLFEPGAVPTAEHCLAPRGDSHLLFRVYVPTTDPMTAFRQVRDLVREARQEPTQSMWIDAGLYGIAILAESPRYASDLALKLQRGEDGRPGLTSELSILIESPPSPVP